MQPRLPRRRDDAAVDDTTAHMARSTRRHRRPQVRPPSSRRRGRVLPRASLHDTRRTLPLPPRTRRRGSDERRPAPTAAQPVCPQVALGVPARNGCRQGVAPDLSVKLHRCILRRRGSTEHPRTAAWRVSLVRAVSFPLEAAVLANGEPSDSTPPEVLQEHGTSHTRLNSQVRLWPTLGLGQQRPPRRIEKLMRNRS
jgi:hypothetical protein